MTENQAWQTQYQIDFFLKNDFWHGQISVVMVGNPVKLANPNQNFKQKQIHQLCLSRDFTMKIFVILDFEIDIHVKHEWIILIQDTL